MTAHDHLDLVRVLLADDPAAARAYLASHPVDWAGFGIFTDRHRLSGLLYRIVDRDGLAECCDRQWRDAAKAFYTRQWTKNERLTRVMAQLAAAFDARSIDVLFLKGPVFTQRYYGDIDARAMSDLDLLVRDTAGIDAAERVLREAGFVRRSRLLFGRTLSRRFAHHVEYAQGDLNLELHWALQRQAGLRIDTARLWDTSESVDFRGRRYRVPSAEYDIVIQVLGVPADLLVGKLTLRPLVDVQRVLASATDIDWPDFWARRHREGILTLSVAVLQALRELFGSRVESPRTPPAKHPPQLAARFLDGGPPVQRRLTALQLYDAPLPATLAWWAVSLPVRLAVYREETARAVRESLRGRR